MAGVSSFHLQHQVRSISMISNRPSANKIVIPVFPLRKRVKFPTEKLKLTLWEERYKMLARYVLDNPSSSNVDEEHPIFGALYCSHKTQVSRGGTRPITPLVECGDIGIICSVTSSEIFIDGEEVCKSRKDEEAVEKIRLWGLGVARFRVDRILSDGLDEQESNGFILVEGTRIDDEDIFFNSPTKSDEVQIRMKKLLDEDAFDKDSLMDEEYAYAFQEGEQSSQTTQMLTFALASNLEATAPADEMLDMLSCTSTLKRLEYLERKVTGSYIEKALKSLFN